MLKFYRLLLPALLFFFSASAQLPSPTLVGYWHNWNDASAPYIQLDQVDSRYNVIAVAFAIPRSGTDYDMTFTPSVVSEATLKTQILNLQASGKKVVISIGGANDPISLSSIAERDQFVLSMGNILQNYKFDGLDIDVEGSSLSVTAGTTIANPTDVAVVNMINAIKTVMTNYQTANGKKLLLTMAPETAFVQGGMSAYSGIWGAYLPVIHGLRDQIDLLHVQLYNSGSMYGIDGKIYTQGTPDFIVAMSEAMIKGFNTNGGFFTGFAPEKIAVGLPACSLAAGGGYVSPTNVQAAINYLRGTGTKPGTYVLQQAGGYPTFGGMMTWSINWDKLSTCGGVYEYAQNFQTIFGNTCPTPAGLTLTDIQPTTATASWTASAGATSYTLQYRPVGAAQYLQVNTTSTSYPLTALLAGTTYEAAVKATCTSGSGGFGSTVNFTTLPDPNCGTPATASYTNIQPTTATASWAAVTGATSYVFRYKASSAATYTEVSVAGTTINLTGLLSNTLYEGAVKSVCSAGSSAFGAASTFTTLIAYSCNSPYVPTFSNITASSATASWRSVKGATGYVFRYKPSGAANYTETNVTSTSISITNLAAGTTYLGSVRVVCRSGVSAYSSDATFTTLSGSSCPAMAAPAITNITNTSATATWAPASGAVSYVLRYKAANAATYTEVPLSTTSYNFTNLTAGSSYVAGVKAVCSGGVSGNFSTDAGFNTTGGTGCPAPAALTIAGVTTNAANATWTAVSGADAYEFSYHIKGSLAYWTNKLVTTPSYSMSGLKAGTLYETQVRARCNGVFGTMSANVEFTTSTKSGANRTKEFIAPAASLLAFTLHPNPATQQLNWQSNHYAGTAIPFSIMNMQGKTLLSGKVNAAYGSINISSLANGMYYFNMEGSVQKFVVLR